jgi:hypothetical protein
MPSHPIRLTTHAVRKLAVLRGWGFQITEETVIGTIRGPEQVHRGYGGRLIAQARIDETHTLRVVFEENDEIVVVTLYPGRRERYGDQV